MRAELEKKASEELAAAQQRAQALEGLTLRIEAQAGPEGRLFGSVGTADIAAALAEQGIEIERSEIRMAEGPLRSVGMHSVDFHLHTDVNVTVTVFVDGGDVVTAIEEPEEADAEEATDDDADE
jgi:large subunit ribosomal protein L9